MGMGDDERQRIARRAQELLAIRPYGVVGQLQQEFGRGYDFVRAALDAAGINTGRADPGRNAEIVRLHTEESLTLKQIAERLGVSSQTIRKVLRAAGIEIRVFREGQRNPKALSDEELERRRAIITQGIETGTPNEEIANNIGLSIQGLQNMKKRFGLPMTHEVTVFTTGKQREVGHRARQMWIDGHSAYAISQEIGVMPATIERWAAKYGWQREAHIDSRGKQRVVKPTREELVMAYEKSRQKHRRTGLVLGSAQRVAKYFGVSSTTAIQWMRDEGIPFDQQPISERIDEIIDLYRSGLTIEKIAEKTGFGAGSISNCLKGAGVEVLLSQQRRTEEDNKRVAAAISVSKVGSEVYELFSSREAVLEYLNRTGLRSIKGIEADLGVSHFYITQRIRDLDLWDEMDHYTSWGETEVRLLLGDLGIASITTRSVIAPYEIDIWSEPHRIGIEYNGNYYHSEIFKKDRFYHQKKSLAAIDAGARLYHIFEYEWVLPHRRRIIEGQIKHLFGISDRKIGARKCDIIELSTHDKRGFLEANHLQGNDASTVKLGLRHQGELVAVMTFRHPHLSSQNGQKYQWELSRYATQVGTSVPGGATRLFHAFVRRYSPKSVLSYSDLSRSSGTMYETLGFEFSHISVPNYVWVDRTGKTLTRYQTQIKNEVPTMQEQGFYRIYDCGNKVWVWRAP